MPKFLTTFPQASLHVLFLAVACGGGEAGTPAPVAASSGGHPGTSGTGSGAAAGRVGSAGSPSGGTAGTTSVGGSAGMAVTTGGSSGSAGQVAGGSAGALSSTGGTAGSGAGSGPVAGSGGTGGAGPLGSLTLSDLKIEPNPNMTISCFVSWKTTEAASSEVQFGETGYEFRIRDEAPVTDHRVLVIGMHAEKKYQLKAVSSTASATGSLEGMWTAGKLPSGVPLPMLTKSDFASSQVGWTLMNIQSSLSAPAAIVMYDENGMPVWYFIQGTKGDARGDISADYLPNKNVLVGPAPGEPPREVDLSGKVVWEGPSNGSLQTQMTHFINKAPNGNYFVNRELDKEGTSGSTKVDNQRLEELSPDKSVIWSWELFDHVTPGGSKEELCHGNSLTVDDDKDIFYYNCRWVGMFKASRSTGEVAWRMGGSYDKNSIGPGDFTYIPPESQFSDCHDPEIHADGTIIVYDNGGFAMGGGASLHSRVVEYQVNEAEKTATRVWEFPGTFDVDSWYKQNWYTSYWGDADVLANDNVLIMAGVQSGSSQTRVFEVTRAGKVVWEIVFPARNGSFRAERLSPPPLVEKLP